MPELPELVVIQEILSERIVGRPIVAAIALHPNVLKTVEPGPGRLVGQAFRTISRRGKHLIFTANDDLHMVLHLMQAGRLVLCQSHTQATKATAFLVTLEDGEDLRMIESSKIHRACVHIVSSPDDVDTVRHAGVEPLSGEFTLDYLVQKTLGRKQQLKKLLTDQAAIAGIGTAYADEILFDAKLSPIRYGTTLDQEETRRLHTSVVSVLSWATDEVRAVSGGATLTPHERSFARVYGRTGSPCPDCSTRIAEIRYAQTKTYYCPNCQSQRKSVRDRRSWLSR